jgi:Polyketide cyclase / dehydrase and lipid transport
MQPVTVTTRVPYPREQVYDFLDVMANHEPFTNHMLIDWEYSGPERGVGSRARVKAKLAGRTDVIDMEVVAADRPFKIVEQNVGAHGRRRANGTYTLQELPDGGTGIAFEYAWRAAPVSERLAAPVVRAVMRRGNERAMQRLCEQLAERFGGGAY